MEAISQWLRQIREKEVFDEMWDIPRLYASVCSNSCQLVPLHPIIISILFHHYKELKECVSEVERIQQTRAIDSSKNKALMKKEEEAPTTTTTLDSYLIKNKIAEN